MLSLKRSFPFFIVLLVLYQQVVSLLINFDLYQIRDIFIYLAWIPVFSLLVYLLNKKAIYQIILTLFFIDGFFNLAHLLVIKGPITASSLFVLLNTNLSEATDFVDLKADNSWILILPFVLIYIFGLVRWQKQQEKIKIDFVWTIILLYSVIFLTENALNGRLVRKGIPPTEKALISFYDEAKIYANLKKRSILPVMVTDENSEERKIFVLILGESLNRNHLSLYGYKRETTPKLEKRGDIIRYDDVVSPFSNTLNSVLSMLTESNLDNQFGFDSSLSLIDIFHSSGYKTFWISNQSPIGVWDNGVFNVAQTADVVNFVNQSSNSSFESLSQISYDERLFEPFKTVLKDSSAKKMIIIHLMGSHAGYSKRFPESFEKFKGETSERERIINDYDNSVFYNDFIIDSLISVLNQYLLTNKDVSGSMIYISDHGENVFDENDMVGHDFAGKVPNANIEIPMLVWLSPKFQKEYPEKLTVIEKNRNLPFLSDDLFYSILDLNGISYAGMKRERSIFNIKFDSTRMRILSNGQEYKR